MKGHDKHGVGVMMFHNGQEYFGQWLIDDPFIVLTETKFKGNGSRRQLNECSGQL